MHFLSGVEPQCSTNTAEGQRVELCGYIYRRADSSFFFFTLFHDLSNLCFSCKGSRVSGKISLVTHWKHSSQRYKHQPGRAHLQRAVRTTLPCRRRTNRGKCDHTKRKMIMVRKCRKRRTKQKWCWCLKKKEIFKLQTFIISELFRTSAVMEK